MENKIDSSTITGNDTATGYNNKEVSRICQTLNRQNRMAKLSSFECQGLFLSLYFKDHFEITQAVVTNLRSNGFWAYVPKFDFRAPVYLSDIKGVVQMDPVLFKLKASSGLDPTTSFASSKSARRFTSGRCTLCDSSEDVHLEVNLQETAEKYEVRLLDVVTVNILCDDWNAKSRVPRPRIHLIADSSKRKAISIKKSVGVKGNGSSARDDHKSDDSSSKVLKKTSVLKEESSPSIYDATEKLETPTNLNVEFRCSKNGSVEKAKLAMPESKNTMIGRVVFGNFTNPDTRSAQQEASIKQASAAALERRNQAMASRTRQNEYDTTRRIESGVTTRMQRLAANKRNTRRGKTR